jgi:hypothetical protein
VGAWQKCLANLGVSPTREVRYREFEEVAKRRMTDPTSTLVSDVGDMNFERIFLGDSEVEDWNFEDIDGLSEGMSGLEMDEN